MMIGSRINSDEIDLITELVGNYFKGLHTANIDLLQSIFHAECQLQSPGIRRNMKEWFEVIQQRDIPEKINAPYAYRILSLDIINDQAMVKVLCPLLGRTYIDFLSLLKENNQWQIVNKMYADA